MLTFNRKTLMTRQIELEEGNIITVELIESIIVFEDGHEDTPSYLVSASNIKCKKWYNGLRDYLKVYRTLTGAKKRFESLKSFECKIIA